MHCHRCYTSILCGWPLVKLGCISAGDRMHGPERHGCAAYQSRVATSTANAPSSRHHLSQRLKIRLLTPCPMPATARASASDDDARHPLIPPSFPSSQLLTTIVHNRGSYIGPLFRRSNHRDRPLLVPDDHVRTTNSSPTKYHNADIRPVFQRFRWQGHAHIFVTYNRAEHSRTSFLRMFMMAFT